RRAVVAAGLEELLDALREGSDARVGAARRESAVVFELGPRCPASDPEIAGARSEPYESERARWREVERNCPAEYRGLARSLAVSCAVTRWLLSLGVVTSVRARGEALVAAAVLGGVVDRVGAPMLAARADLEGTSGELAVDELSGGPSTESWDVWR